MSPVFLVGAGPGDPGLLTVRARELLDAADVVLYDRLIPDGILDGLDAELVYVGKRPAAPSMPQEEINDRLVEEGGAGRMVVRLKGGDPFVFGRGGEEGEALRAAGIPFEVVPGVTAGIAASAYAGIPVTHRDVSSAVAFVTGHEDPEKPESALDWPALAAFPGTLVFYMGVRGLPRIASALIAAGRPADQPAAVVEGGTLPRQRTITAPLGELPDAVAAAGVKPPALTVVGDVAGLREHLRWFEDRPLHGRSIVVTRARAQSSGLASQLRALGATVIEAPAISVRPLRPDPPHLATVDLVCFTSTNAVELFLPLLRDARALAGIRVAAVGMATAQALQQRGVLPDVVAERAVSESLAEALLDVPVAHALIPRAAEARDALPDALRSRGARVDVLPLYETVAEPLDEATRTAALAADLLTFTSSSTVRFFLEALESSSELPRAASIGPITSATLRENHIEPAIEATRHDVEGLVEAIVADAAN